MPTRVAAILLTFLLAAPAAAASCGSDTFDGIPYTACVIDPAVEDVRLALNDADGERLGTFSRLDEAIANSGRRLVVAMNAGMYRPDRFPVGLYIEDGEELAPIVTREGPGNFGMLPNGVLCLGDVPAVVESRRLAESGRACRHATQSGPMLVIDGALHPRFIVGSDFTNIRNGVGVRTDGALVLAISDAPVNFETFARLFRDRLGTPNALYLDGRVSRLWAPGIGRRDGGFPMGPMIAVTAPD